MSLAGITTRLANGTYVVTRAAPGTRDARGVWVPGATSTIPVTCAVYPGTGGQLVTPPEGRRLEDVVTIYSETELRAAAPGPDRVTYAGASYTVFQVKTYAKPGYTLYEALAAKETTP